MARNATAQKPDDGPQGTTPPAAPKVPTLFVIDTTCPPGQTKTHAQIVNGIERPYTFEHAAPLELPEPIAMKFLRIKEFIVTDHDGNQIEQVPEAPDQHSRKPFVLEDDQVVARLSELEDGALWKRCQQFPGGDKLGRAAGRGRFQDFLVKHRQRDRAMREKADSDRLTGEALAAGADLPDVDAD